MLMGIFKKITLLLVMLLSPMVAVNIGMAQIRSDVHFLEKTSLVWS